MIRMIARGSHLAFDFDCQITAATHSRWQLHAAAPNKFTWNTNQFVQWDWHVFHLGSSSFLCRNHMIEPRTCECRMCSGDGHRCMCECVRCAPVCRSHAQRRKNPIAYLRLSRNFAQHTHTNTDRANCQAAQRTVQRAHQMSAGDIHSSLHPDISLWQFHLTNSNYLVMVLSHETILSVRMNNLAF